jgi:hypothetical protein
MSAIGIVNPWRQCVAGQLLPELHGHLAHALADLSFAMAVAGHCQAGQVAPHVPTEAQAASNRRRFERLLANPRLQPREAQEQLARQLTTFWDGRTVLLILDETPKGNDLRALCVRVAYQGRALPLAAECYLLNAPPQPMPQLVCELLEQVQRCLPTGVKVVLLADRGLAWPILVDWCTEHSWHYVIRLQGQTKVTLPDGRECTARDLAPRVGRRWLGDAEVFKKAGWRGACVVATWERDMKEAWLLLTDQRASLRHCRTYGKRMWTEESFRDDKSSGLHWEKSHVNDPVHASRLLVLLAMAMILAASTGSQAQKAGHRRGMDPHRRHRLSIIQLGLRWLRYIVSHNRHDLLELGRLYLYPK